MARSNSSFYDSSVFRLVKQPLIAVRARMWVGVSWVRVALGLRKSEENLIDQSQQYWDKDDKPDFAQMSHWRGSGIFADDDRWLALGKEEMEWFEQMARSLDHRPSLKRVVEWRGPVAARTRSILQPRPKSISGSISHPPAWMNVARNWSLPGYETLHLF
ncbi:MAG: hypothetical protein ACSLE5_07395 [Porticoccaceae bacterium]